MYRFIIVNYFYRMDNINTSLHSRWFTISARDVGFYVGMRNTNLFAPNDITHCIFDIFLNERSWCSKKLSASHCVAFLLERAALHKK